LVSLLISLISVGLAPGDEADRILAVSVVLVLGFGVWMAALIYMDVDRHNRFLKGRTIEYVKRESQVTEHRSRLVSLFRRTSSDYWERIARSHASRRREGPASQEMVGVAGERIYVVVPKDAESYWLRCNREVEARRYCQRIHLEGYDLEDWTQPVPHGTRFVCLIGRQ
jgi:hypothetical protein